MVISRNYDTIIKFMEIYKIMMNWRPETFKALRVLLLPPSLWNKIHTIVQSISYYPHRSFVKLIFPTFLDSKINFKKIARKSLLKPLSPDSYRTTSQKSRTSVYIVPQDRLYYLVLNIEVNTVSIYKHLKSFFISSPDRHMQSCFFNISL